MRFDRSLNHDLLLKNMTKSESAKKRYEERISAGLCTRCGKNKPRKGKLTCIECYERDKNKRLEREKKAKESGICIHCFKNKVKDGTSICESCSQKKSQKNKKDRLFFLNLGICPMCRKTILMGSEGVCPECSAKNFAIKQKEEYKKKQRDYANRRHKELKGKGMCQSCCKEETEGEHVYCTKCLEKMRRTYLIKGKQKRYEGGHIERYERPNYGMCYICGEPVKDGFKLCEKCYEEKTKCVTGWRSK